MHSLTASTCRATAWDSMMRGLFMGHPPIKRHRACALFVGGCYDTCAAGSGVGREVRGGACRWYAKEEHVVDGERRRMQGSRARDDAKRATAAATCTEDKSTQTTGKCNTCGVRIGDGEYCAKCSKTDDRLIDGVCVADNTDTKCKAKSVADGTCESCGANYFLHKGGCYSTEVDKPGRILCTTAREGVCTQGAEGYFAVPGATKTDQSVVKCDDSATGVPISTGTYKGVADCAVCTAPKKGTSSGDQQIAICNKCTGDKIVKTAAGATSCIDESACSGGFFVETTTSDSTSSKVCTACTDDNCDICAASEAKMCSKCKTSGKMYLKKENDSATGTCVDAKECTDGNTYYTDDADPKTCKACSTITGCSTCSSATVCTRCQEQKYLKVTDNDTQCVDGASNCGQGQFGKPDADKGNKCVSCKDQTDGVTDCETCEYNTATSKIKCTKCGADKYLKTAADGATTCETNCGDGYFQHIATGGLKTCQLCAAGTTTAPAVSGIQNCASCTYTSSTLKCTACGSGYKLEGEACVPAGVNLSTGAIAGISVAAVVVVGGLVGFLCWWFVCRGKA